MAQGDLGIVVDRMRRMLGSEEIKEIGSLLGVGPELLKGLEDAISVLAPIILDAEKKKSTVDDKGLKDWLMNVEDAVYDADNLLADLSAEALRRRSMNNGIGKHKTANKASGFFSTSTLMPGSRFNVRLDMEKIKERLDKIAAESGKLDLEDEGVNLDDEGVVTKRAEDKEAIIENLLTERAKEDVRVHAIVGADGIEKTRLARDVVNDERVKNHFDHKIWVRVSHNFDTEDVLIKIFEGEIRNTAKDRSMESLRRLLRFKFRLKACLIVLDVVDWSNEDLGKWESLIQHLEEVAASTGSKILVTTSRMEAAVSIRCTMLSYPLQILDKQQSWILFQEVVGQELPKTFRTEIVTSNCIGLPIAITAIGISMLRSKSSGQGFLLNEKGLDEILSRVFRMHNFMILRTLKLSYNELPSPLKSCFAYCSLFPKDYEIDVQTLIKLWMAQGFIEPSTTEESPEVIGYDYFLKLLQRYFFEEVEEDVRGRVAKCRMHEWVREFAIHVAENQCRLLTVDGNFRPTLGSSTGPTFHVSFHFDLFSEGDIPYPSMYEGKVRSIILPCQSSQKNRGIPDARIPGIIISRFRRLRALDMHDLGIKIVPDSIGNLKLLKYLDLSENEDITELPNSITNLVNLQTLRLSSCFGLKRLPSGFNNLTKLRHLEIEGCYNLKGVLRDIGQARDLQISELVVTEETSVRDGNPYEVAATAIIDKFHIKSLGHAKDEMAKYENFTRQARSLSLEWKTHTPKSAKKKSEKEKSDEDEATLHSKLFPKVEELSLYGFRGERLFSDGFPSNVVRLSLWRCENCKILPPLDQLSVLKVLVLDQIPNLEYISDNASSSMTTLFPSLQELWLTELPNLQGWWKSGANEDLRESFHCLSKLVIEDCPMLVSMPLFPTLEEELVLDKTCCWEPFRLTMFMKTTADRNEASSSLSSSSTSPALSKLKKLSIVDIEVCKADEIMWDMLKSLRYLRFDGLPHLAALPEGLQRVTSLEQLQVWRSGLEEIPKWIGHLKNLQKLVIRLCPKLNLLHQEINQLIESEKVKKGELLALLR